MTLLTLCFAAATILQPGPEKIEGTARARSLPLPTAALAPYDRPAAEFPWTLRAVRKDDRFTVHDLTFPSAVQGESEENNTVWCRVWRPAAAGRGRSGVVLIHYLKGSFEPMEIAGRRFAEEGLVAALVYLPHYGRRKASDRAKRAPMITADMDRTLALFHQGVLDVRRAGDWLAAQPDVDPTRVGIFGVSLGAVVGALAAGVDPHFAKSVLVIGGADLAHLILHDSPEMNDVRLQLRKDGWTPEKLAPRLRSIEPMEFAGRVAPQGVLMINAERDQVIPRVSTEQLHRALGEPRLVWMRADHYTIALLLPQILRMATDHLNAPTVY